MAAANNETTDIEATKPKSLLDLPSEIRTRIWELTLEDERRHHIYVVDSCWGRHNAFKKNATDTNYPYTGHPALWHLLFARKKCPNLLLLNRQIYQESILFMSHEQVFEVCDNICLSQFMELAKSSLLPKRTVIEIGTTPQSTNPVSIASMRQWVRSTYGDEVKLRVGQWDSTAIRQQQSFHHQ